MSKHLEIIQHNNFKIIKINVVTLFKYPDYKTTTLFKTLDTISICGGVFDFDGLYYYYKLDNSISNEIIYQIYHRALDEKYII